ncbi:hypothetical protein C2869_09320 [Saccharobesus litoralis]|uniref:Uncharacterized protein n=1 Tax=Saccharobesus litoralis TaxID=2172099 RepID=A0A2S0VQX7_9ALTE|nr:tetratricopeptide repeat protein [Saccharobesus litoralis]AWB66617.1 hypothetical protein C2869_09320 [Saccharobesus litoralis]
MNKFKLWLAKSACCVPLLLLNNTLLAEDFALESAIINSTTQQAIGGTKETGSINQFFVAQKKVVYSALQGLGVDFDQLPASIKRKIEKFHTTNFEAFHMFSMGLDAQDQGKFAEAKAFFEKAIELDPDFGLAGDLSVAMPPTNVQGKVQLRAAITQASKNAASAGKASIEVDMSKAMAALAAGRNVVVGTKENAPRPENKPGEAFTSNEAGDESDFLPPNVIGLSYEQLVNANAVVSIASVNAVDKDNIGYTAQGELESFGSSEALLAQRNNASNSVIDSLTLADGSTVQWGAWNSADGNAFSLTKEGQTIANLQPELRYMIGEGTRQLPGTGSATFTPAGGHLNNVSGNINVDFVNRTVQLNELGFDIGDISFAGLNSSTTYDDNVLSQGFNGNFESGSCIGCRSFSAEASTYTGNFLGNNADGVMLSTMMTTVSDNQAGTVDATVSGTHVFIKQ